MGDMASGDAKGICQKVNLKPFSCPHKGQYKFLPNSQNPGWSLLFFMLGWWDINRTPPVLQALSLFLDKVKNQIKLWPCYASVPKAVLCTSCLRYKKIPALCRLVHTIELTSRDRLFCGDMHGIKV